MQEQVILEIKHLYGDSIHEGDYPETYNEALINWDKTPKIVVIICSYSHPSVSTSDQVDELPLGPGGAPGFFTFSTNLYFKYCHSYDGDGSEEFGYNVESR